MAKARYYSSLLERGPLGAKERVYKLQRDQAYLSLNHLIRLDQALKLVKDSKSKSTPKPWVLTAADRARIEAAL